MSLEEMITCTHCNRELSRSNFTPKHRPGGWCKGCHNSVRRDKRAGINQNPVVTHCLSCGKSIAHLRSQAKYCNSTCSSAYWHKKYPEYRRKSMLKHSYGITVEEFDRVLSLQGSVCAICKTTNPGGNGWHVDHCHNSDIVRGILCGTCNQGLGNFKDNITSLVNAVKYLADFNESLQD